MLKLKTSVNVDGGVYNACISLDAISPETAKLLRATGDLEVDVGGAISGTASRTDEVNTVVQFTYTGDAPTIAAQAVVTVDANGTITAIGLTNPGQGYEAPVGILFVGQGTGASATCSVANGAIAAVVLTAGGVGYKVVPTPVSFTLDSRLILVPTNLPVFCAFDVADFPDADLRAQVWISTVVARIQAAYDEHLELANRFVTTRCVEIK